MPPESSQIWKIGDCLELIKEIPDDSIDMILSDMPFGITQNQWDKRINLKELWIEYYRVIKPNRAMALTSNQPFTSELIMSNLKDFRYMWIWVKNAATGHLNAHKQPMRKFEDILIFSKGKIPEYNPQELISYGKIVSRGSNGTGYGLSGKSNFQKYTNYPTNILYFDNDKPKLHPAQQPVALFEYLIKTYTNEGDIVYDSCLGSGTTLEACAKSNRSCIGHEISEDWEEFYPKRIL